jgi:hypothetical protein
MNKLNPLVGLLAFFLGATNKIPGGLSEKGTGFIQILKDTATNPTSHLPTSVDDYKNRLMASPTFKVGLAAAAYGYLTPYIPYLGSKLPLKGVAKKLGTTVAIAAAAGAVIDPSLEELGLARSNAVPTWGAEMQGKDVDAWGFNVGEPMIITE